MALGGAAWAPAHGDSHVEEDEQGYGDAFDVFLLRSDDGGASFGEPRNVSDDVADSRAPAPGAHDGVVHVAWRSGEQPRDISYRRGVVGDDWGRVLNVSDNAGDSAEPDLAATPDGVTVVWVDTPMLGDGRTPDPRYLRSDEVFGRTTAGAARHRFGPTRNVSNTQGGHSRDPVVAAEARAVVVVFEDVKESGADGVFASTSTDGGRTWSRSPVLVSGTGGRQTEPAVTLADGRAHAVWQDESGLVGYSTSPDAGVTWTDPVLLPEAPGEAEGVAVAAGEDAAHVLTCADDSVQYYRSTDVGTTWSEPVALSSSEGCGLPAVAVTGDGVLTAWESGEENFKDIAFRRSTDGGATFEEEQNLSATPGPSAEPSLTVDRATGQVYLAWADTLARPGADRPAIRIGDATVAEPVEGEVTAAFEVTLDSPVDDEVTVEFATVDGSAVAGEDYRAREGMLIFDAGETSRTIEVVVDADEEVEPEEAFEVVLTNPQVGVVVDGRGVGTIQDAGS